MQSIIATDISRDGTLGGTNLELYRALLKIPGVEITASGGIAKIEELETLGRHGCHAAILGKSPLHRRDRSGRGRARFDP